MLREYKQEFELVLTDDETRLFNLDKVQTIEEYQLPDNLTYYCALDGAFSEKDSADYSAFAVVGIDKEGRWYLLPYVLRTSVDKVVNKLFELYDNYGFNDLGIEKGSFRLAIQRDIEKRQLDLQKWFNVTELSTTGSKISRIKALTPVINSGLLTIVDTGEGAEMLFEQIALTDNTAVMSSHDDILDATAQLLQMNLYYNDNPPVTRDDYLSSMEPVGSNYI
jgi:predicted phage terminase large subunit-like protein